MKKGGRGAKLKEEGDEAITSQVGSVESEGSFPPSVFDGVEALDALRNLVEDLAVDDGSLGGCPVQNPIRENGQKLIQNYFVRGKIERRTKRR